VDWKLSPEFNPIVSEHHSPRGENGSVGWDLGELIKVSCRLADCAGFPAFPGCAVTLYEELLDLLAPKERSMLPTDLEMLQEDVSSRIQGVESV
jgi:hypothetical protein